MAGINQRPDSVLEGQFILFAQVEEYLLSKEGVAFRPLDQEIQNLRGNWPAQAISHQRRQIFSRKVG